MLRRTYRDLRENPHQSRYNHNHDSHGRFSSGEPVLSAEQYSLLKPKGGFNTASRVRAGLTTGGTKDSADLYDSLVSYQKGGASYMRNSIAHLVAGDGPDFRRREAGLFLNAVAHVPAGYAPKTLYRGMGVVPKRTAEIRDEFAEGKTVDFNVSSFTSDPYVASRFPFRHGSVQVRMKLVGDNIKALPLQNLTSVKTIHAEHEWVTDGRFRVTKSKWHEAAKRLDVTVEQEAVL